MVLKKLLYTVVLGASLLGSVGCNSPRTSEWERNAVTKQRVQERSEEYLEDKINDIAVYQDFRKGRYGVSYDTFTNIAGIPKELGNTAYDKGITVEVGGENVKQSIGPTGRVRIDIPYEKAQDIFSKLSRHRNNELDISPGKYSPSDLSNESTPSSY